MAALVMCGPFKSIIPRSTAAKTSAAANSLISTLTNRLPAIAA
jgi:hypothetical protein